MRNLSPRPSDFVQVHFGLLGVFCARSPREACHSSQFFFYHSERVVFTKVLPVGFLLVFEYLSTRFTVAKILTFRNFRNRSTRSGTTWDRTEDLNRAKPRQLLRGFEPTILFNSKRAQICGWVLLKPL